MDATMQDMEKELDELRQQIAEATDLYNNAPCGYFRAFSV